MNDTIAGAILEKSDEMFEEALSEEGKKSYLKAFESGLIKGAVDGCFIAGAVYLLGCTIKGIKEIIF